MPGRTFLVAVVAVVFVLVGTGHRSGRVVAGAPQGPALTLEEIKEGIARRARTYSDGHFTFTVRVGKSGAADVVLADQRYDLYKSGARVRFERVNRKDGAVSGVDRAAWDGARRTGYHERPGAKPVQRYGGTIVGELDDFVRRQKFRSVTHDELPSRNIPLAEVVRVGNWQVVGQKVIGGSMAWGIRNDGRAGGGPCDVEIWVCPERGFAPVDVTELTRGADGKGRGCTRLADVELTQRGDRWVFRKARVLTTNSHPKSNGEQVDTLELTEYSPVVPKDVAFAVKFPVGTSVLDLAGPEKRVFIAGKCVLVRQANGGVRAFDLKLFPEYVAMTDYSAGLSDEEYASTSWARVAVEAKLD